ncbi:hypothetical protein GTH32_16610 [Alteromonas sp. 345S023]|uniref:Uncharacterized protein n=1 Tax=Alteromonas profundi TaxID=2696062 RepID=A0A7X5LPS6_9ALTE|nr:hypothetical protein [Alteromonas profundi]NDV92794.1 hypothetical protein [Alteromonas profundi]
MVAKKKRTVKGVKARADLLDGLLIPESSSHPTLKALWYKLKSTSFAEYSTANRKLLVSQYNRYYEFLQAHGYLSIEDSPITLFNEYGVFINRESGVKPYRLVNPIVLLSKTYLSDNAAQIETEEYDFLVRAIENFNLQRDQAEKKLTLAFLFEACPYTDVELLISLRLICAHIITTEYEAKKDLLHNNHLEKHIEKVFSQSKRNARSIDFGRYDAWSSSKQFKKIYEPVMRAIYESQSDIAKERLLTSIFLNRGIEDILDSDNIEEIYNNFITVRDTKRPLRLSKRNIIDIKKRVNSSRKSIRHLAEKYGYGDKEKTIGDLIKNPSRKSRVIDKETIEVIKEEYLKSPVYTKRDAARDYGVSSYTITDIFKRDIEQLFYDYKITRAASPYYKVRFSIPKITDHLATSGWTLSCYNLDDFIFPDQTQQWALMCLLASDGVQTSGMQRLLLNDCIRTESISGKKSIQFNYVKGRANANFSTALYSNSDRPRIFYQAYEVCYQTIKRAYQYSNEKSTQLFFQTDIPNSLRRFLSSSKSAELRMRLFNPNSVLRKTLEKRLSSKQVEPALWLLRKISDSDSINLLPSTIRETFVAVTGVSTGYGSRGYASARLSAHNEKTHKLTYLDRYPAIVKEQLSNTPSMAIRIGQLMEKQSNAIEKLARNNISITVSEAKRALGLGSINDNLSIFDSQKYKLGLCGEISLDKKKIYLATPGSAALIIKRLQHLKNEVPAVISHQRNVGPIFEKLVMDFILLSEVLSKFPKEIVAKGEKLYLKLPEELFPPQL